MNNATTAIVCDHVTMNVKWIIKIVCNFTLMYALLFTSGLWDRSLNGALECAHANEESYIFICQPNRLADVM